MNTTTASTRMRLLGIGIAAAALLALSVQTGTAQTGAQTPATTHQRAAHKPRTGTAGQAGTTATSGPIIGNKHTHVYHLSTDKGSMPSAKNRVYFQTEAEARAAGYHAAKTGGAKRSSGSRTTTHPHPPGTGQPTSTGTRK